MHSSIFNGVLSYGIPNTNATGVLLGAVHAAKYLSPYQYEINAAISSSITDIGPCQGPATATAVDQHNKPRRLSHLHVPLDPPAP
jgi:hypothetical protein